MPTTVLDIVPPNSIEAEQSTLGAMLIERSAVEKVFEILDKEDFYRENHQILFDVITFLTERDEPIDLVTVPNELKSRDQLDAIGGMAYLASLFDTVPTTANVEFYTRIVKEKTRRRGLMAAGIELAHNATDTDKSLVETVQQAQEQLLLSTAPGLAAWERPVPFSSHQLPAFPVEALPPVLGNFVLEIAASVKVPPDLPALLGLGVVSAAASRTCRVQIGQTHSEPLNLFVACIMGPGGRKSQVMPEMVAPLKAFEKELARAAKPVIDIARDREKVQEKRISYLQETITRGKTEASADAQRELDAIRSQEAEEVPAMPRLLVDDITPEQLAPIMADQKGTIALSAAEGGIFGTLAGRYSNGTANLDLVLKGHAGEEVRVDRKGSPPVFIASACLTMLLAVQPDVLSSLADTPSFRGRGLLGRFLYTLPEDLAGTRFYDDRSIDPTARSRYEIAVKAILSICPKQNPDAPEDRHMIQITGNALSGWAEYANEVELRQAAGEDLAGIRDWASKLAGAVARIAGGMHLLENAGRNSPWNLPISEDTVLAAWAVGQYLIAHALAAFGSMAADPNVSLAQRLLAWIERKSLSEFSFRDCHQAHRNIKDPQTLLQGLTLLCEHGYLRLKGRLQQGGRGRSKSPVYEVNPLYSHTQNTQK